jgi:hypothetical protein
MSRPLPELVTNTRQVWRVGDAPHDPHEPTAQPKRRQANADTTNGDDLAHTSRIVALVGAKYNTKRPTTLRQLIENTTDATPEHAALLLNAAQELRNRHLAATVRPDLPRQRYALPEQLAALHRADKRPHPALDIAAIHHHPTDTATYLANLAKPGEQRLTRTAESTDGRLTNLIDELHDRLRTKPNAKHRYHLGATRYNLNNAELNALQIAQTLAHQNQALRKAAQTDKHHNEKRRKKTAQQQTAQRKHGAIPDSGDLSGWYPVIPNKPPREIAHLGRLGRKRIATHTGKNPNRLHNYYGDPMRRIFTRKTRGTNALVVVDVSGSMSLSTNDLDQILKASAGATVVAYSASDATNPNTHLLAHNSRRVRHLPDFDGGNGIDAPAVLWAIKNYRKHGAPILWITDGGVTGKGDKTNADLSRQCRRLAQKYGVTVARHIPDALKALDLIKQGKKPANHINQILNKG